MLSLEVGRVDPSKGQLTTLLALHIPVKPEAEDWLLHQALIQHLVEGGYCPTHRDLWESQTLHDKGVSVTEAD